MLDVRRSDGSRIRALMSFSEAALRCAAGRARGRLRELLLDCELLQDCDEDVAPLIEELVAANGSSLRKLRVGGESGVDLPAGEKPAAFLSRLLGLAPSLVELDARSLVFFVSPETCDVLRGRPPFDTGVVRVPNLLLETEPAADDALVHSVEEMLAVVAAAEAHAPLKCLQILGYLRPEELDAWVGLAARRKLEDVAFKLGSLVPESLPSLCRLLHEKSLTTLNLCNCTQFDHEAMFDFTGAHLFANALRANCTLERLTMNSPRLFDGALSASLVLAAATAHPSLAALSLVIDDLDWDGMYMAHPLAALVAANSSELTCLKITCEKLGDEGFRPLALALPQNKTLVLLHCDECGLSEQFMRESLLPVVVAHTSLLLVSALQSDDETLSDELNESRDKTSTRLQLECARRWPASQYKDEVEAQMEEEDRAASADAAVAALTDGIAAL